MLNRFYFPPTLPHSTHIRLWCRAGNPTQDLYQQERQLRPSQNMQKKKMLNRFYFPPTLPHSTHILFGAGPENQHMTSITKNDNSGPHKIFNKKNDVKSILFPTYPPAFHPHSFVVPGWKSNTGPLSPRRTTPAVTKYAKKDVKSILFPI
ncbi:hypothetical protein TNCV_456461 [Trichonephila clavipes]|uniref:Uncharacterized protein n=1 Tax=Trichonephila clavipes TaxID=2585209 RepID=A0A8X6RZE2_TRICX|nr:hypothetical protein TNCV_456461 [Trichonephila clavipes]